MSFMLLITVGLFYDVTNAALSAEACLVSSLINTTNDNVLSYPEFYFPFYNENTSTSFKDPSSVYNCSSTPVNILLSNNEGMWIFEKENQLDMKGWIERLYNRHKHQDTFCVTGICPLNRESTLASWSMLNWNFSADALCNLGDSIQSSSKLDKLKVKIIGLGGSMTYGHGSLSFCCDSYSDISCDMKTTLDSSALNNNKWYCSWFGFLKMWFIHAFQNVQFEFHMLAIGGTNSFVMATEVEMLLAKRDIQLSSNDIVILDFSCNDNGGTYAPATESLVRAIYRTVARKEDKPTIIIMEQLPFPGDEAVHHHYLGYRNVAEYYHLPIYSHYEIAGHPLTAQQEKIYSMLLASELHIPWHGHLLIADEFAQWIAQLIDYKCPQSSAAGVDGAVAQPSGADIDINTKAVLIPPAQGEATYSPVPVEINGIYAASVAVEMVETEHVIESVSSPGLKAIMEKYLAALKDTAESDTQVVVGASAGVNGLLGKQSSKKHSWLPKPQSNLKFLERLTCRHDVPNLLSAEPTSQFRPDDLKTFEGNLTGWTQFVDYHPPGAWIINDKVPKANWTLSFPIPAFRSLSAGEEIGLRITYMKTYFNAGFCYICLCGSNLWMGLDAFSASKRRESVQHVYHFKLDSSDIMRCNALADSERLLSIVYIGNQVTWNPGSGGQKYPERDAHKVKIYSAALCYLDNEERRHKRRRLRTRGG